MTASGLIVVRFPKPSNLVQRALDELRIVATAEDETDDEIVRVAALPRPWDPPTCSVELRRSIYTWLDAVVGWINEEHTWRTDRVVPSCWDQHPHVVHELATVAILRWETTTARTADGLEQWHRVTLPDFLKRISDRIGETGCPPGRHQPSPGQGRNAIYREEGECASRRDRRSLDAESPALPDGPIAKCAGAG